MKRLVYIFLFISCGLVAQNNSSAILTFDKFMERVEAHHPLAIQANLKIDQGDATLRKARGSFDPKVFSDVSQKQFDDKQYYNISNSGLKIPTWYGVEVSGGYSQSDGVFLNPENKTPGAGLWYAGVSVSVGQGLFIDKRRAELKQAKIYKMSTVAERELIYNNLLYDAGKAYWSWFESYNSVLIFQNALEVTQQRFQSVKQGALFGDKPFIDTVEASIQVQNRMISLQESELQYKNASALLSVYMWLEGVVPLEIAAGTRPNFSNEINAISVDSELKLNLDSVSATHPLLRSYLFKIEQLEIDKRLKQEQIKPQLNLKYNAINQPVRNNAFDGYNVNNYTWGVEFSMPIFLRKERGSLEIAKLKINEAELELSAKEASITYKAQAAINDLLNTNNQLTIYERTVKDYAKLLDGERKMFNAGESSLFMVNSRESGYIKTQLKYVQLLAKNHKASLTANYALGLLFTK
jgi:outer membrane protein TolC